MGERTVPAVYYDRPGPENTDRTLQIAKERATQLGIRTIIVATTQGDTGVKAVNLLKGFDILVVTHSTGFTEPNVQELTPENRAAIEKGGGPSSPVCMLSVV